jgi:3-hydroxybutyryl-CoA dehydrogenase
MSMSSSATNFSSAGVAGAGTMGAGIAITIARAGLATTVFDSSQAALERARRQIGEFFEKSVARGKLDAAQAETSVKKLTFSNDIGAMVLLNVVVEAIYEDLRAKHALLAKLDAICSPETLFLTNTSTLSITELAAGCNRQDRVVGAHYCLPAQLMKLVEMSKGIRTSEDSWQRAWAFELATNQQPVETKDRPGFVLNFFCVPYHNDVIRMIEANVAKPAEIDRAMKAAMDFAMGPCELIDLIGLDTQLRASEAFFSITNNPRTAPPPLLRRMVAAGMLGRKTKRGFYDYGQDAMFGA